MKHKTVLLSKLRINNSSYWDLTVNNSTTTTTSDSKQLKLCRCFWLCAWEIILHYCHITTWSTIYELLYIYQFLSISYSTVPTLQHSGTAHNCLVSVSNNLGLLNIVLCTQVIYTSMHEYQTLIIWSKTLHEVVTLVNVTIIQKSTRILIFFLSQRYSVKPHDTDSSHGEMTSSLRCIHHAERLHGSWQNNHKWWLSGGLKGRCQADGLP